MVRRALFVGSAAVWLTGCSSIETLGIANLCEFDVQSYGQGSRSESGRITVPAGQARMVSRSIESSIRVRTGPTSKESIVAIGDATLTRPLVIAGTRYADFELALTPEMREALRAS